MTIDDRLALLKDLAKWIDTNTHGIQVPVDDHRKQIASACFDVAIEHQTAIALLGTSQLFGSMHAMMRILIEATVRGLWIWRCASEQEEDKYRIKGKIEKTFAVIAASVEVEIGAKLPTLSMMVDKMWDALNDVTHTGYRQVIRRHGIGTLGANYPQKEIENCIAAAGAFGLLASVSLASMAQKEIVVREHFKKMEDWNLVG